jgi:hypothetical protein
MAKKQPEIRLFAPIDGEPEDIIAECRHDLGQSLTKKNTLDRWKARVALIKVLNTSLDKLLDPNPGLDPNERESGKQRIESILAELREERRLITEGQLHEKDLKDLPAPERLAAGRLKDEASQLWNTIEEKMPTLEQLMKQERASEAQKVMRKQELAQLQSTQQLIPSFDSSNPAHITARDHIANFNREQGAVPSQIEENDVGNIFNLLVKHPDLVKERSPKAVIESAIEGISIVKNALKSERMGDWHKEQPRIIDHLLPALSKLDAEDLKSLAPNITKEYADSIWGKSSYSPSAFVGAGPRSIKEESLQQVASASLNKALGPQMASEPKAASQPLPASLSSEVASSSSLPTSLEQSLPEATIPRSLVVCR